MPKHLPLHLLEPMARTALLAVVVLLLPRLAAAGASEDEDWHTRLADQGRSVSVAAEEGGYRFAIGDSDRFVGQQAGRTQTASLLFDAMFALAQAELAESRVDQIRYEAFDKNRPFPCECLVAGQSWPWVWTRDIAYATDLGVFRFDPRGARNSLEFKLSPLRPDAGTTKAAAAALYVVQDTGSGGSWPVSTDRVAWFLGARHLLADPGFSEEVYKALTATLAQDRTYTFDAGRGLYRGETSFLDWREQSYPAWTAQNVVFIAESFALSTNVVHYEALQLAARMAQARHDAAAARYGQQAAALKTAIDRQFWREDRGLYMSYIGGPDGPRTIEAYDLLGTSLAIVSGVAPAARARHALANYPSWDAGSPVIWPEHHNVPVYHNRAIWPFVSAYALKAARVVDDPARIAHELRSILRVAALAGSNMENDELEAATPAAVEHARNPSSRAPGSGELDLAHADDTAPAGAPRPARTERPRPSARSDADAGARGGDLHRPPASFTGESGANVPKRQGPVINSRRQLWSIGAFLDVVVEGVFGLTDHGTLEPKLPRELLPMLFGDRDEIRLTLPDRKITLVKPKQLGEQDNLLVAATTSGPRADTRVQLRGIHVAVAAPPRLPFYAPDMPARPTVAREGEVWRVHAAAAPLRLYVNDSPPIAFSGETTIPYRRERQCISVTARGPDGVESLPTQPVCVGESESVGGPWPRSWSAARTGRYELRLGYLNTHGPVMTGITAAVKKLVVQCAGSPPQSAVLVMPQARGKAQSTAAIIDARAGQHCTLRLDDGFNMSYLAHYTHYTGGAGGGDGSVNTADTGDLMITKLP